MSKVPQFVAPLPKKPIPEFKPSSLGSAQSLDALGGSPANVQVIPGGAPPILAPAPVPLAQPEKRRKITIKSSTKKRKAEVKLDDESSWETVADAEVSLKRFLVGNVSEEEQDEALHLRRETVAKLRIDVDAAQATVGQLCHELRVSQLRRNDDTMQCVTSFYNVKVLQQGLEVLQQGTKRGKRE